MSKVRKFRVKSKLSTVAMRGGITAAEALSRADEALDPYRGEALVVIDALLGEMAARFGPGAAGREVDARPRRQPAKRARRVAHHRRRAEAALRAAPRGAHILCWGGDGVLRWSECLRFWTRYATPVTIGRIVEGDGRVRII